MLNSKTILKKIENMKGESYLPLKLTMNLCCANCNVQFFFRDFSSKGSRCPMLLKCGHSVCESCLQQSLKEVKKIICQNCNFVSLPESEENSIDSFSLDAYMLGNLVAFQNYKLEEERRLRFLTKFSGNFNYSYKKQTTPRLQLEDSRELCEECSMTAYWYCENCQSNFCEMCWSRVHGSARSLMKHYKSAICLRGKTKLKKCPQHETQTLEFFCINCSITICSHCIILQHQGHGHSPITLKEKNMEMLSKVKSAVEIAKVIKKRMKLALEKVKFSQSSSGSISDKKIMTELRNEIRKKFFRIHGILQLEEERCLKKLYEKTTEREKCLKAVGKQLESQIKKVESLLMECDFAMKKPHCIDLTQVHKQLEEVHNFPCFFITTELTEDKTPTITFDESLEGYIQKYCSMDIPLRETFQLLSSTNLPEDYIVEPLEENGNQEQKSSLDSSASDAETMSNCSSKELNKDGTEESGFTRGPKASNVFLERRIYSIRVTYIRNPEDFYIVSNSQKAVQQDIEKKALQVATSSTTFPNIVKKDEIYLVQYDVDKNWYRGRVVKMSENKIDGEESVIIYYLDYGNLEIVPLSRLRAIPEELLEAPPLAVKCKLFNCVPRDGEWCRHSSETMEDMLKDKKPTMFVMKVLPDCLEVDISVTYPDDGYGREIVSVRDALIFLDYAVLVNGSKVPLNATAKKYLPQSLPSVGETFHVFITHVNSPSDFYVQRTKYDTSELYKLTIELQKYYEEYSHKGVIYNPVVGMPCAAMFSVDQKWYRAKILEIPTKKMVKVLYVDYGNEETIPWNNIRKLKECFVRIPPLALHCSLAGIVPTDNQWNIQTKYYLEKCILLNDCRIQIQGRQKNKQKVKVWLFKKVKNKEICTNQLFVEMGYAILYNINLPMNLKLKDEITINDLANEKAEFALEDEKIAFGTKCFYMKYPLLEYQRKKLSAKKLRELHKCKKKSIGEELVGGDSKEESNEYDSIFKVKVNILSAESPSCIYVTFSLLLDKFEKLQEKMNDFYKNSPPTEGIQWTVGTLCAVYNTTKSNWYRASILSILPNNQVTLFLKDVAEVTTEPESSLRELDSSFAKYSTCAVKCHLADIRPPGEQWPGVSCEQLRRELESYNEIYMTKKGKIENKSLPIELWVKKLYPKGALEPTVIKWVTVNRLLVNQGLAIPKNLNLCQSEISSNDNETQEGTDPRTTSVVEESNEKIGEETIEGASPMERDAFVPPPNSKWLPPEPLSKKRFIGVPTFVDLEANIYIHDLEDDVDKLKMVCEALLKEYENSEPEPEDQFWSPGQLCVARYHLDQCWYRGLILRTNENMTYEVLFVDYGNTETCETSDLRKRIKMHNVPIIAHKFKLHRIEPITRDGKWPIPFIDILHSLIVDKKCEVKITNAPTEPNDPYIVSLTIMKENIEVSKFCISQGLAFDNAIVGSDSEESAQADSDYLDSSKSLRQ